LVMAENREPTAAAFALEIDGKFAGNPSSFDGGDPIADVVETPRASAATDKSIRNVHFDDIVVTTSFPEGPLGAWLTAFLEGKAPEHDGAVILLDLNRRPLRRIEWKRGALFSVAFPALDGRGKEAGQLTIAIRPAVVKDVGGGGQALSLAKVRSWNAANFSLSMPGINCARVMRVEPLVVTQTYLAPPSGRDAAQPGPVHVSDLVVTVSQSGASDFALWAQDFIVNGKNSKSHEKDATVRYLASNMREEVASLDVMSTGIFRVDHESQVVGVATIAHVKFSMYAKQVRFATAAQPAGPAAEETARPRTDRDLSNVLGQRLPAADMVRRLQEPSSETRTDGVDSQRRLGRDVGFAWAQRHASVAELREVAAADDQDWSSLSLPEGHSLAETLTATINLPLLLDGRLELPRDALAEGLLSGVLEALADMNAQIGESVVDTSPTTNTGVAGTATPAFRALPPDEQRELARNTVKVL
jgi:hypothetical protein